MTLATDDKRNTIHFDELGITRLFVDEAHNFKNVPFETKTNKVLGISGSGSKKCQDMMDKVHMIQKKNGGKGVILRQERLSPTLLQMCLSCSNICRVARLLCLICKALMHGSECLLNAVPSLKLM